MQDFKPKHYRLVKPELFKLDRKKLYLAAETPAGYTLKIEEGEWVGFPKRIVENNLKLFKPYDYGEHKQYNRDKRQRVNRFLLIKRNSK